MRFNVQGGCCMPAGFSRVGPHPFRNDAQPCGVSCPCRQLQPAPLAQVQRAGDGYDNQRRGPIPERFFGHSESVGLVGRAGQHYACRVHKGRKPGRVQGACLPAFAYPQHHPIHPCGKDGCECRCPRAGHFMDTGGTQKCGRRRITGHAANIWHAVRRFKRLLRGWRPSAGYAARPNMGWGRKCVRLRHSHSQGPYTKCRNHRCAKPHSTTTIPIASAATASVPVWPIN